jgi:release factor glutamine methyltransferase
MTETEAKRRIDWQNKAYKEHLKNNKRITIDFHGRKIVILPNVFAPEPQGYNLLTKTILKEVKETDRVLDMGTGTGIQAIFAASKSTDVTAVDVNPEAVKCAKLNIELNNLSSRVKASKSDLFENVQGKFDVIIFDPPFRWSKPRDMWERSCADENYATMNTFFSQAKNYLKPKGRILIHFGTSGDLSYLKQVIRKNGLKRKQILKNNRLEWTYFTYRLTR